LLAHGTSLLTPGTQLSSLAIPPFIKAAQSTFT
jgi:hypothetical protein